MVSLGLAVSLDQAFDQTEFIRKIMGRGAFAFETFSRYIAHSEQDLKPMLM